jgi:hypothetical protein
VQALKEKRASSWLPCRFGEASRAEHLQALAPKERLAKARPMKREQVAI